MKQGKDGRYPHEKSIEGARNSVRRRAERAKEEVREVYEHGDGGVTVVYETHAVRLEGVRRTLIPLDLVEEYPIVMEFSNGDRTPARGSAERGVGRPAIEVRGDLRCSGAPRRARSGTRTGWCASSSCTPTSSERGRSASAWSGGRATSATA